MRPPAIGATATAALDCTTLRQRVAEELLGTVKWESADCGLVRCPGADLHTHTPRPEAKLYLDNVPTITCFHKSCRRQVEAANHQLRSRIAKAERGGLVRRQRVPPTPEVLARREQDQRLQQLTPEWERWFWQAIQRPLTPDELYQKSPTELPEFIFHDARAFLRLFHPQDIVWSGQLNESQWANFRTVRTLIEDKRFRAPFITPSTFKPRTSRRRNADVLCRRFLVVESDVMSLPQQAALLLALAHEWPLAAVISSGGKSLHGWFRWQPAWDDPAVLRELKARLEVMHCDPAALTPCQPFRCPGVLNTNTYKFQALLYLDLSLSYVHA